MTSDASGSPLYGTQEGLESRSGTSESSKIHNSDLAYLDGLPESGALPVREEPHHRAARHRTDTEIAALTDPLAGDELRDLRRAASDNPIRTINPTGGRL